MPVAHKTAISFGLVHIPVGLYTATQDNDIRFNQLCRQDKSRVRYKKVCAGCGREVSNKDIVKGFEYEEDKFVVVTDDDFEKIKTEKDKSIRILHFTDRASIEPIYYDKTYHVVPEKGGEKAFELLREAMRAQDKIAVAQSVLGSKDTLLTIMPSADGILIETMFFLDEIRELPKAYVRPNVDAQELKVAQMLIESMDRPFDAAAYKDEYQQRLRDLIQKKINGKAIVAPKKSAQGNVIDLMEALQASLKQQEKPQKKKAAPRKNA
ncbi:MAG: Ku protein [Oscillospiraceae bacterium]|nr:Ku protein [Oscillospiraceae bacterium]